MLISSFIDGLIGFYFARKHREDEAKWADLGVNTIDALQSWLPSSEWNFSNKLSLLKAEYYFLKGEEGQAMFFYQASIKSAHDHRFIHEEGLAEEKLAAYLLHKGKLDAALVHYTNAKQCYELWGANALVKQVEKAIAILFPMRRRGECKADQSKSAA